jgi:hypothetical protein
VSSDLVRSSDPCHPYIERESDPDTLNKSCQSVILIPVSIYRHTIARKPVTNLALQQRLPSFTLIRDAEAQIILMVLDLHRFGEKVEQSLQKDVGVIAIRIERPHPFARKQRVWLYISLGDQPRRTEHLAQNP